ncbi:MAG: archease [bacterium]
MKSYKFASHTADVRLLVKADNLKDLFKVSLEGLVQLLKKNLCKETTEFTLKEAIKINSPDRTALLIDFLSEVLTCCQINKAIYCKVEFKNLENKSLECTIYGKKVDKFDEDIKAVTYHEAEIKKENGIFQTNIIFDI